MKPEINKTFFGSITADSVTYEHDIFICLDGTIKKRKKKLSKKVYGTSHTLSHDEAKYIYEEGAQYLLIGTGHEGKVQLSPEAKAYFEKKHCQVELLPTPQAIQRWNTIETPAIGLFHITC